MSTASRSVLVLAGLAAATCMVPSGPTTDATERPDPPRLGEGARKPASAHWHWSEQVLPPAPAPSLPEATVAIVVQRPVSRPATLNQPSPPTSREAIGRELQRELKRVGCY